jgi:rhodanese-related sulfurtransferase
MEPTKITVHDAKGRLDREEGLLLVDARSPEAWAKSDVKLPGAIRMNGADELRKSIPANRALITYCT